ncbi:MAG: MerR family transcriptional regulator [Acidobacteria bacterium]|nr:MAG: MerR family transcriptional regulator [Acidobacteriota bacterium]
MTVGELARRASVNVETIRFYQRRRLLAVPSRPLGGIRRYGAEDLARLEFIKHAQRLGFSLGEVHELLRLEDGTHCREARSLGESKLALVRSRLADLRHIERALRDLVHRCGDGGGRLSCPLIAALQDPGKRGRRLR